MTCKYNWAYKKRSFFHSHFAQFKSTRHYNICVWWTQMRWSVGPDVEQTFPGSSTEKLISVNSSVNRAGICSEKSQLVSIMLISFASLYFFPLASILWQCIKFPSFKLIMQWHPHGSDFRVKMIINVDKSVAFLAISNMLQIKHGLVLEYGLPPVGSTKVPLQTISRCKAHLEILLGILLSKLANGNKIYLTLAFRKAF